MGEDKYCPLPNLLLQDVVDMKVGYSRENCAKENGRQHQAGEKFCMKSERLGNMHKMLVLVNKDLVYKLAEA